jgi:hypothetical protein
MSGIATVQTWTLKRKPVEAVLACWYPGFFYLSVYSYVLVLIMV